MRKELSTGARIFFTVIVGVFIIGVIFGIFKFTVGKHLKELKAENTELEEKIATLQDYVVHMDEYLANTDKYAMDISNIVSSYEATTSTPSILHDYENLFKEHKLESSALSFQEPEILNSVSYTYRDQSYNYDLQQTQVAITYRETYDGLMKLISQLNDDKSNKVIMSINMSPDTSDGSLTGSINIVKYTVNGETQESVTPELDNIKVGVDKVFNVTSDSEENDETEESED